LKYENDERQTLGPGGSSYRRGNNPRNFVINDTNYNPNNNKLMKIRTEVEVEVELPYFTKNREYFYCIIEPTLVQVIEVWESPSLAHYRSSLTRNEGDSFPALREAVAAEPCEAEEFYQAWDKVKKTQQELNLKLCQDQTTHK